MYRFPTKWPDIGKLVLGFLLAIPCFVCVINFVAAERPSGQNGKMPANWSAGVMNHGHYFEWYTISDQPLFFAASVIGFILAWSYLVFVVHKSQVR